MVQNGFSGLDQLDDLVKKMNRMSAVVTSSSIDKALRAGAEIVKDKVKNHPNMPVSDSGGQHAKDNIVIKKKSDGVFDIGVTDEFFYLFFHEVGTTGGTWTTSKGNTVKTPAINAKPFLRPSFEENKQMIQKEIGKVLKRELGL